jgi:4-hydroxythreonine-4-phosphate dehydrogenase
MKPRIAMVLGDPAGIGPELIARLLAEPEQRARAAVLLIADRDELEEGFRVANARFDFQRVERIGDFREEVPVPQLLEYRGGARRPYARSEATANGGRYSLDTLQVAIDATAGGAADAICFGPLNKTSLHLAGMDHSDELHWFAERLGFGGPLSEINALDNLWTSRVTSHVALKDVSALINESRILEAIGIIHRALTTAGMPEPRIAVCGLNPHNGDGGAFGREEIEVIAPAVERARALGFPVAGPFPADTIFIKARDGEYDAVVTMYHDQGQIAIKLMGFSSGVTVQGGLPIPITTPAHGTAFDIAGQGRAHPGAMRQAFATACRMALTRRNSRMKEPA